MYIQVYEAISNKIFKTEIKSVFLDALHKY